MVKRVIALVLGLGLCGCNRAEDESTVYIMPVNCTYGVDAISLGPVCPQGDYPTDTSFAVFYAVNLPDSEVRSETCSIEQTGELDLTIHTSWVAKNDIDAGGTSYFECDDLAPPLAAGTWTIHHGSASSTLEIPSSQVDTVCVWGTDQSGDVNACTEHVWAQ